jgi:hypothetical protein
MEVGDREEKSSRQKRGWEMRCCLLAIAGCVVSVKLAPPCIKRKKHIRQRS